MAAAPEPASADGNLFEPAQSRRAFDDVILQIRQHLKDGTLKPGDRLPSERELAERFELSRNTVREAIRMLEIAGLVTIKKGSKGGAFVSSGDPNVVSRSLTDMLTLSHFSVSDLTEVRMWLGSMIARAACQRATDDDLDRLEENFRLALELADREAWDERTEVNHQFHNLLAASTGNPVVLLVQQSITNVIREIVSTVGPVRDPRLMESKGRLLDRLLERDEEGAVAAMEAHLRMVNRLWQNAEA